MARTTINLYAHVFDGGYGVDYSCLEHDCVEYFAWNLTG